ncbi:MAG: hypothetical protein LAP87_28965 [Acidobacteriia bacterium]|nr:hypothetical protein [Terriglobia bacterium]
MRRDRCNSCGHCGSICPHGCLDVLHETGTLVRPGACTSDEQCVYTCPEEAIHMVWAPVKGDRAIGRWRSGSFPSRRPVRRTAAAPAQR